MKSIILTTEEVRAMDGRKTQTRRIVKPQPSSGIRNSVFVKSGLEDGHGRELKIPFQPGDILYVRETWQNICATPLQYAYKADGEFEPYSPWKPSIHMPKEAARLFTRVIDIKAERWLGKMIKGIKDPWVWVISFERVIDPTAKAGGL